MAVFMALWVPSGVRAQGGKGSPVKQEPVPLGQTGDTTEPVRADSRPRLLRRVPLGDYGSKYMRLGDLNGDGMLEALFVQVPQGNEHTPVMTCLTAVDLEGNVLWQVGKPDIRNLYFPGDFAVQIHDIDRDGKNEVICIPGPRNVLKILEGKTGNVIKEIPLDHGGRDSILFADFSGNGYPQDLLIKDRYSSFWVYDKDFALLWSKKNCNPGHYPMEYDIDGDKKDELLCGYTLYGHDGKELWTGRLPAHNDAVYIDDMDGDGKAEIGIAASGPALLLDRDGKVLFQKLTGETHHVQHVIIGKFRTDLPGKQVCFLDRGNQREDAALSKLVLFTKAGEQLWNRSDTNLGYWCMAEVMVENWTGKPDENIIGLYSRGYAPAGFLDGNGIEIATFPIPEGIKMKGGGPNGKDLYDDYYIQHINCWGDDREEVFVYNHQALYIYTNGAPGKSGKLQEGWLKTLHKQIPRMYNNTFYPGRL